MYHIGPSNIHGDGVIASDHLKKGDRVGLGIVWEWTGMGGLIPLPIVTDDLGKWINHSYAPNAYLKWHKGAWHIVTNGPVARGQELTLDYAHTPFYIEGACAHYV